MYSEDLSLVRTVAVTVLSSSTYATSPSDWACVVEKRLDPYYLEPPQGMSDYLDENS